VFAQGYPGLTPRPFCNSEKIGFVFISRGLKIEFSELSEKLLGRGSSTTLNQDGDLYAEK
jgi:hypothetical protein